MSYAGLGVMSPQQMSIMAANAAAAQAQQRHDQEQQLKKIDPKLAAEIAQLEGEANGLWRERVQLKKELTAVKTDIAAYEQASSLQSELDAVRRKQLLILGGAVGVGVVVTLLFPRRHAG